LYRMEAQYMDAPWICEDVKRVFHHFRHGKPAMWSMCV
jgi:hypothetical protein